MVELEDRAPAFTRYDMGITDFWREASAGEKAGQREWQETLCARGDVQLETDAFVSRLAVAYPERLRLGARSYVSAHVYLWGDVTTGADCTLNPFSEVRGDVRLGDGVRVGAHTSILGFNHSTELDRPIWQQPLTSRGIVIGDDVWIGSHVVILDGVTVGAHSIIGAGSVVTKDVPEWSVVGGNPARVLRDRRAPRGAARAQDDADAQLQSIGSRAAEQLPALLARARDGGETLYVDRPGAPRTVRALCDAVELAALFDSLEALSEPRRRLAELLAGRQESETGLVPEIGEDAARFSPDGHAPADYHVLAVGYALRQLGARFRHSVHAVARPSDRPLLEFLDALDWRENGWRAGSAVDALATAMLWNAEDFGERTELEALFGWLVSRCDPATGMWGAPTTTGWLEPVNGFYRITRGSFAQFGLPLPYPERTIDTVLAHAKDARHFGGRRGTACNVLDVIHPLWLASKQTPHRHAEGEDWARVQLSRIARSWQDGAGFSFALQDGHGWQAQPGLLGTEMWLSITWYLADYLGLADALPYRPSGVHRPEPLASLGARPW